LSFEGTCLEIDFRNSFAFSPDSNLMTKGAISFYSLSDDTFSKPFILKEAQTSQAIKESSLTSSDFLP